MSTEVCGPEVRNVEDVGVEVSGTEVGGEVSRRR